jgi:spore coat polysaccharide biosynthesis protein SpsF
MKIYAFVQARMNSSRYPGKVLAPLNGQPLIYHVIKQIEQVVGINKIIVLTSKMSTDDPLVAYLERVKFESFRGSLNNVFERFQDCLKMNPCDYFFRICGDSPFLSEELLKKAISVVKEYDKKYDLVTNVLPRTFPVGMSVELLKSTTFFNIDLEKLTEEEREHVTKKYYNDSDSFKIAHLISSCPGLAKKSLSIDRLKDLKRAEEKGQIKREEYINKMRPIEVCYE